VLESVVNFLDKGESDTLLFGEGDERLLSLADSENIAETGSEGIASGVLNMGDLIGTWMVLNMLEDTNSSNIVSTIAEDRRSIFKFNESVNFASLEVQFDRIVLLDVGVREADGPAVVGDNVWDFVLTKFLVLDLAELEARLFGVDAVSLETSFNVVEDSEVFAGLGDGNDIHEAEGEPVISPDFVVNLDIGRLVLADLDALLAGESVLESVAEKYR